MDVFLNCSVRQYVTGYLFYDNINHMYSGIFLLTFINLIYMGIIFQYEIRNGDCTKINFIHKYQS